MLQMLVDWHRMAHTCFLTSLTNKRVVWLPCKLRLVCRGQCILGFCRCNTGFFGLDCGLSINPKTGVAEVSVASTSAPVMAFAPWPKFYLVDVPPRYRLNLWSNAYLTDVLSRSPYRVASMADAQYFWFLHTTFPAEPLMKSMFNWWQTSEPFWNRRAAHMSHTKAAVSTGHRLHTDTTLLRAG